MVDVTEKGGVATSRALEVRVTRSRLGRVTVATWLGVWRRAHMLDRLVLASIRLSATTKGTGARSPRFLADSMVPIDDSPTEREL